MLKEMCDELTRSKFDVNDLEKENQIQWSNISLRCFELAKIDPKASELESGVLWAYMVRLQVP